jgi:catalase (peroxidase I)
MPKSCASTDRNFVGAFVMAWDKVMNLGRFEPA